MPLAFLQRAHRAAPAEDRLCELSIHALSALTMRSLYSAYWSRFSLTFDKNVRHTTYKQLGTGRPVRPAGAASLCSLRCRAHDFLCR